jgi:hypothetical protein
MAMSEIKEVVPPRMAHPHPTFDQQLEHGGMASPLMNDPLQGGAH